MLPPVRICEGKPSFASASRTAIADLECRLRNLLALLDAVRMRAAHRITLQSAKAQMAGLADGLGDFDGLLQWNRLRCDDRRRPDR